MEFSYKTRKSWLNQIQKTTIDVVVVGGGINGAGVARESALKGYTTVLLEKGDFSSGTSSRSSGMLHGGLRYLQYGKLKLVYEALKERNCLLDISNDIAHKEEFIFPVYGGLLKWFKIRIGVSIYDFLAGRKKLFPHKVLSKKEVISILPEIKSDGLNGAIIYGDALVDDSGLVLATIKSACESGTKAANYTSADSIQLKNNQWIISFTDSINKINGKIVAKTVVLCAGVWSDKVLKSINKVNTAKLIRPTKGIHITLATNRIKSKHSIVIPSDDGRILFLNYTDNYLYIGTTDTDFSENLNKVEASKEEINYIIDQVNHLFPQLKLLSSEVISTWAGLRPLVNKKGDPGKISREEKITEKKDGLIILTGGKLTTYRNISKNILQRIDKHLFQNNFNTYSDFIKLSKVRLDKITPLNQIINFHLLNTMAVKLTDIIERRERFIRFNTTQLDRIVNITLITMEKYFNWNIAEKNEQMIDYKNSRKSHNIN